MRHPDEKWLGRRPLCIQIQAASKRYRNNITDWCSVEQIYTLQHAHSSTGLLTMLRTPTLFLRDGFLPEQQTVQNVRCWRHTASSIYLIFIPFLTSFGALSSEVLSKNGQTEITTTLGITLNKSYAGWSEKGKNLQRASIPKLKF